MRVLAICGSTRTNSYNRRLLRLVADAARSAGATVDEVDLRAHAIPFYDGDLEEATGLPVEARWLREQIEASDALLLATPEYNGSLPAVLKNAIDWVSRPIGGGRPGGSFRGRPVLVMSASPGASGGAGALAHLDTLMRRLGANVLETRISLPGVADALDGELSAELKAQVGALGRAVAGASQNA